MAPAALQRNMTWAEDRATQRCDPSADPGAKTDGGGTRPPASLHPDWQQALNLRGTRPRLTRLDVARHSLTADGPNSSSR